MRYNVQPAFQWAAVGIVLIWAIPQCSLGQDESASQPASQADVQISELIERLNADRFAQRQAAMWQLMELGSAVIEPLESSIYDGQPEMRMRSMAVLQRLAVSRDADTQKAAQEAIQRLAESADANLQRLAAQTMSQLADALQDAAIDELQKLGAEIDTLNSAFDGDRYVAIYSITIGGEWQGTPDDLKLLQWTRDVTTLTLIGDQIDDQSIKYISTFGRLHTLIIKRAKISNASIKTLLLLRTLNVLQLVYCQINDDSAQDLEGFQHLTKLQLYGTGVSREVAVRLAEKLNIEVDFRVGAFLGVYYDRASEPCTITRVVPGSSADKGGIRAGDIILSFDGHPIESGNDFQGAVSGFAAGQKVTVVVQRDREEKELHIQLGEFMDAETLN